MKGTAVLVVGGGLVGLSAAVFLAWRGVKVVVVEKHAQSSLHPRAIGFTPRTLELLRAVGLGDRVEQAPPGFRLRRARVESLAGTWFEESAWTPENHEKPRIAFSPCTGAAIAQDKLEPILRARGTELGAELIFSTEVVRLEQDPSGVTATLRDRDGKESRLRAAYAIAADGHRSPTREALGIGRNGRGHMRTQRSVLFRADLEKYLASGVHQFQIDQPDFKAFLTTYADGRWVLMFGDDEERDEATLNMLVKKAIGRSDVAIEIITTGRWELSAWIADRFRDGRVFLAGDAAHTLPPSRGGFGANTGIEDAHNLAWKLAAVISGASSPALLDTYDAERRPIAWLRHDQIFARDDYKAEGAGDVTRTPIYDDDAIEFGQLYRSSAVIGASDDLAPAMRPDQWNGQPGTRAPHVWIKNGAEKISMLDHFQSGWVLVANDPAWENARKQARTAIGADVAIAAVGDALAMFGVKKDGAALVRPDGYIAWRAIELPADPSATLVDVIARVSFRASDHGAHTASP